jgi:hypothetical protein
MPFSLMKPWRTSLLVAAVLGFAGYVTIFVAPRRDLITQRSNFFSRSGSGIRGEDRNFLDDLVQKQDNHYAGNPLSAPDQNIDKAGTIVPSPRPVPRAELVINTEIVRRGVLVAHSGTPNSSRRGVDEPIPDIRRRPSFSTRQLPSLERLDGSSLGWNE